MFGIRNSIEHFDTLTMRCLRMLSKPYTKSSRDSLIAFGITLLYDVQT
jgi:hypothetical protein